MWEQQTSPDGRWQLFEGQYELFPRPPGPSVMFRALLGLPDPAPQLLAAPAELDDYADQYQFFPELGEALRPKPLPDDHEEEEAALEPEGEEASAQDEEPYDDEAFTRDFFGMDQDEPPHEVENDALEDSVPGGEPGEGDEPSERLPPVVGNFD